MPRKKPAPKKPARPPMRRRKPTARAAQPREIEDASPELANLGFYRGEYDWETDRHVPALDERLRLLVEHRDGRVVSEQTRAVQALLESRQGLRSLALKAAYDCMLRWVEGYRQRHPGFRGKPIAEKPFTRGCELKTVRFPTSPTPESKTVLVFVLTLFWPDDNRPCEVRFEKAKGGWLVTECERT